MRKLIEYDVLNHGWTRPEYFTGCDPIGDYDMCATGRGRNAHKAYLDAINQALKLDIIPVSIYRLISKRSTKAQYYDKVPPGNRGAFWSVS